MFNATAEAKLKLALEWNMKPLTLCNIGLFPFFLTRPHYGCGAKWKFHVSEEMNDAWRRRSSLLDRTYGLMIEMTKSAFRDCRQRRDWRWALRPAMSYCGVGACSARAWLYRQPVSLLYLLIMTSETASHGECQPITPTSKIILCYERQGIGKW